MKMVIGIIIVVLVVVVIVGSTVYVAGWLNALIVWGVACVLTALLVLGGYLILDY